MSREEALRTYAESVNGENTLFIFLPTLPGKLEQMRTLLHDPITGDEAVALDDVVHRRRRYADMIAWLQDEPVSWAGYFAREEFRAEEADRQLMEQWRTEAEGRAKGIEPQRVKLWDISPDQDSLAEMREKFLADAKAEYLKFAHPCPNCGTPAEFLEWCYEVGVILTRCRFCLRQVDQFTEMIGTPVRRIKRPAALLRDEDVWPM